MGINEMTRKQFDALPYVKEFEKLDVDSIVLLPTKKHHDSGYNYYCAIVCKDDEPLGKCRYYDTFSILSSERVGIDCLRGSGLMRIFVTVDGFEVLPAFHEIRKKKEVKREN